MNALKTETLLIGGGLLVAVIVAAKLLPKAAKEAGGLITGNNFITGNAFDASGGRTTAYQGAGVAGTLGAATNAASGGFFASMGDWLGGSLYDLTHADPLAAPINTSPPSLAAANDRYSQGGNASSGSGSYDPFPVADGFGYQWGS